MNNVLYTIFITTLSVLLPVILKEKIPYFENKNISDIHSMIKP